MATLAEELTALKTEEDKITGNKVANFSYDDYAYEHNDANGVDTYNVDNHQNIPNGTASILKVNPTILTKGWRAQASAITRMLMNHFLGRCSYNLNKVNDHFSTLLTKLLSYLGSANGIATLDSDGYVPIGQLNVSKSDVGLGNVVNTGDSAVPSSGGTSKFTTGGAYNMQNNINLALSGKAPTNHTSSDRTYGEATTELFGHVKKSRIISSANAMTTGSIIVDTHAIHMAWNSSTGARTFSLQSNEVAGKIVMVLTASNGGNVTSALYNPKRDTPVSISVPSSSVCIVLSLDFYTDYLVD